jgi:hypothetical protein
LELESGLLDPPKGVVEKSPVDEPEPPSVEYVPDVEGGLKAVDTGRPVLSVGGKVL